MRGLGVTNHTAEMRTTSLAKRIAAVVLLTVVHCEIDVRELTDENWDSVIDGSQNVLVEFYTQARR